MIDPVTLRHSFGPRTVTMNQNHEERQIAGSTKNVDLDRFARRLRRLEPASSAPDLAEMMYRAGYRAAVAERSPQKSTIPSRRKWIAGPAGTIAAALLAVATVAPIAYRQGVHTVSTEMRVTRNEPDERGLNSGDLSSGDLSSGDVSSEEVPSRQVSSKHGPAGVDETPERSRDSEDASGASPERPGDGAQPYDSGGSRETEPDRELAALASTLVAWSEQVGGPREWLGIDLEPTGDETTLRAIDWDRWGEWFDDPSLADGIGSAVPIR